MASKVVDIRSKEFVKPSFPTPNNLKHHRLSFLDQSQFPIYVSRIFFYREMQPCSPNIDPQIFQQISHQLKQSLPDVLTKFYPLAGRIIDGDQDVFVDCNDSGALFVEAQIGALLSQAIETNSISEELDQYLPINPFNIWDGTNRDIPLAVQISSFERGGIAIGVCISHKVADLASLVTFVNAWSDTCRGVTKIVKPNFDFGAHHFPPVLDIPKSLPFSKESAAKIVIVEEKIVTKRFAFDNKKLAELKGLAKVKDPTRVEVVSAYIFKQVIEINRAKVNPKKKFAFSHSVNLRPRMSQQLELPPNEFAFGNLSPMSMSAILSYEEVEKYHDLVIAMRTVIRKFSDDPEENIRNNEIDVSAVVGNPEIQHCHFTSACRLSLHDVNDVNYGWGKPLPVCSRALPAKNTVMLRDAKCGDGIQALVTLVDEEMKMLSNEFLTLEDNDFSK